MQNRFIIHNLTTQREGKKQWQAEADLGPPLLWFQLWQRWGNELSVSSWSWVDPATFWCWDYTLLLSLLWLDCCVVVFEVGIALYPRLGLNFISPCLRLPCSHMTGTCNCAWLFYSWKQLQKTRKVFKMTLNISGTGKARIPWFQPCMRRVFHMDI